MTKQPRKHQMGQGRSLVIHAHFYQPPREDPFLDEIPVETSAAPFHDWNERIERECYRTVVAARVMGADGRIARIVNTLEHISFNVGATLFEWIERKAPDTYAAILAADRASVRRLGGHGNAIAQPYHHVILPLASRRDKVTEVRWGIADFRRRFGREPEGMWLPETAVDDETLDVLAEQGILFTVLAPYQLRALPPNGHPGRYTTANGRTIALFPYDGDISHGIAFGGLLRDALNWANALAAAKRPGTVPVPNAELVGAAAGATTGDEPGLGTGVTATASSARGRTRGATDRASGRHAAIDGGRPPYLVSVATDGETYGHHHRFSEMALARVLEIGGERGMRVENFASWLAEYPPTHEVELNAPSAWSCTHGVERWRSNCGCRTDGSRNPSQQWRTPLRAGLEGLASGVHDLFAREAATLFGDPWRTRDDYGEVDIASADDARGWVKERLGDRASPEAVARGSELLEMERDTLRMFTSCAWFFDDIGGLEPKQVLRYAARAIELSGAGPRFEAALLSTLATAKSNDPHTGTGADVYRSLINRTPPATRTAGAAAALTALGLEPNDHLPVRALQASVRGDDVTVVERRTGRVHRFAVRIPERNPNELTVHVTPLGGATGAGDTVAVRVDDFPELARHAIHVALRRILLAGALSEEEQARVAHGEASLRDVVIAALLRIMPRLAIAGDADALTTTTRLADLLEQLETGIPFDVQTALWRAWHDAPEARRDALTALRSRMGFA